MYGFLMKMICVILFFLQLTGSVSKIGANRILSKVPSTDLNLELTQKKSFTIFLFDN